MEPLSKEQANQILTDPENQPHQYGEGAGHCDYCKLIKKGFNAEHQICDDCLGELPNTTGYCSISCRITGRCDESC